MQIPALALHDVDGIPAYTADIAVPFTGTLTFGVGLRDETAPTAGTAHLLEHLIMKRVGKVTVAHNARTDDETISFFAQGEPSLVADFLSRVARAISTLHEMTDADVAEQRKIVAAELGDGDERIGRGVFLDRFGAQSLGLIDVGSPGHRSITREQVLAFADTWLHAGNAALAFTGPLPDGLDAALPPARPMPQRVPASVIRSGAWVSNGSVPLCISVVLDDSHGWAAVPFTVGVIADGLYARLRSERSLVYSVQPFVTPLDRGARFAVFSFDPRVEDAVATAAEALALLRELASDGPSEESMRDGIDGWRQSATNPHALAENLDGLVASMLRGRREKDDFFLPDLASVTADGVRSVMADSMDSVFVTFGADVPIPDEEAVTQALGMPAVQLNDAKYATTSKRELLKHLMPAGVESFSPRLMRGMGGSMLVIDHDRIAMTFPGAAMEILYEDVALAAYSETHRFWAVISLNGDVISVDRDVWRGEAKIHALLEQRLPEHVRIRIDMPAT